MKANNSKTIAFTGHRSNRITMDSEILVSHLERLITAYYKHGYRVYMTGMAQGFDLITAEAVLRLKTFHKDIQLVCVVPFIGQANRFTNEDKSRYDTTMERSDKTIYISERYYQGCFHRRNDYLVDNSDILITYFDGESKGGTYYTVKRATAQRKTIINLMDFQQAEQWWKNATDEIKNLFSGSNSKAKQTVFWQNLSYSDRVNLFEYYQMRIGKINKDEDDANSLLMEIICEMADIRMEIEYNISRDDMCTKQGTYKEKYQDRFNSLYDDIEDQLLNHDFITE